MSLEVFSDYGSGSSINSTQSWGSQDFVNWSLQPRSAAGRPRRATSFLDLVTGRCSLEDAMLEFRRNGFEVPYCPDDETWRPRPEYLSGMGPPIRYLRQKSWPDPDHSPAVRLPPAPIATKPKLQMEQPPIAPVAPVALAKQAWLSMIDEPNMSVPVGMDQVAAAALAPAPGPQADSLTDEERRVLSSLPASTVTYLLHTLQQARPSTRRAKGYIACRFCKKNRERESFCRSHVLHDVYGRVSCPVLRALVCMRCGASGDHAHTIKYCRLSTGEERMKADAMMRSVRMTSSGRRRGPRPLRDQYVVFGEASATVFTDTTAYSAQYGATPLDPLWAALEQKLML